MKEESKECKEYEIFYSLEKEPDDVYPNIGVTDVVFTNNNELRNQMIESDLSGEDIAEFYEHEDLFIGKLIGLESGKFKGFTMNKKCQSCWHRIIEEEINSCIGCENYTAEPIIGLFEHCLTLLKIKIEPKNSTEGE